MNIALILAGGSGSRMGLDIPKQYLKVCGRPVIEYSLSVFAENMRIDAIQIVAEDKWRDIIRECLERTDSNHKCKGFSTPGINRQLSILNGLKDISRYAPPESAVIIHDAARPRVSRDLIERSLNALLEHDGVLPVLPMKDTVYYSATGQKVDSLLQRECIYAGQAPETFRLGVYLEANRRLLPEEILKINGSTEPAILARMDIAMIPGDECNYKITTKADLRRFMQSVQEGEAGYGENGGDWASGL